jgi:hypothetical protein
MCLPPPGITEEERASTAFFRISRITHDLHGGTQTALARGNPVEVRKGVITTVATVARVADSRRTHDLLGKSRVREGATGHPRGWPHGGRTVADGGRRWQTVADGGRRWQTVADGGGGHSALGWRERVGPSRRRPSRRRSGQRVGQVNEGPIARKIREHLGLPSQVPTRSPARAPDQLDAWSTGPPSWVDAEPPPDCDGLPPPFECDERVPETDVHVSRQSDLPGRAPVTSS